MALKLKSTHLNPYEQAYDRLSVTPYFNQTDWETSMNRSEQDLSSYINLISQYDKLGNTTKYEDEYLWSQMNTEERTLLMYNELYGDKTDEKEWDITVGQDADGNDITEKFKGTEYQYYDKLLKNSASLKNEQNLLYERQIAKDNKNFFELLGGSLLATVGEFTLGVNSVFENTVNFMDAGVKFICEMIDVREGVVENWEDATKRFRDEIGDEYFLAGMKEYVKPLYEALVEWERDNTYYMTVDGQRTTAGKLLGDNFYSIGQMAGSIISNYIVPGSGQIVFYGSMFEDRLQDKFRNDKFNSISTELIVGEAAIETGAEYLVEFALSKLFGTTSTDELRGVSGGRTLRDIVSAMPRKGSAVARYVSDALQEGTEELLQELSTWGVANLTGLIQDEFRTDITVEQLTDAFIGGAFSSLIIGGFNSTYNYFYNEGKSKAVSIFDPNYVSLNENVLETGKETKEQKRYRRARDKFTQTKELIEEFSKYEVKPHKLGLGAITETYDKLVGNVDVTSETGIKFLKQLNKQMYASYKLMMDVYGKFGIDRATKAESLLSELNKYADANQGREYVDESVKAVQTLSEQIDKLLVDKDTFEREKIKDATKKAIEKADKTDTKKRGRPKGSKNKPKETDVKLTKEDETEVKAIFDKVSKSLRFDDGTTEELKTATELANLYSHELEIWNNHEIIEVDGKIFAPIKAAENLSAEELMKAGAENTIVNEFNEALPIEVKNKLTKFYNEFAKVDDSVDAIWHTLYDRKFYNYVVNRADEDTFNILKTLDNLSIIKIKGNTEIHMYREYNLAVRRIRKTMGPILALYFCNNPDASLENVTAFDEAQLKFINDHRYNNLIYFTIINDDVNDPNYNHYLNVVINRINNTTLSKNEKDELINDIQVTSPVKRVKVFKRLEEYTNQTYFSRYNDKYRKKGFDVASARINAFLDNIGITYSDLLNGNVPSNRDDLREAVINYNGDVNDNYDVYMYYRSQFEIFTDYQYTLSSKSDRQGNVIDVEFVERGVPYQSKLNLDYFRNLKDVSLGSYVDPTIVVNNVNKYLPDIFKIDAFELAYTGIDDVISYPERYLTENVLNEINERSSTVNKTTVSQYIRKKLVDASSGEVSIVLNQHGKYVPIFTTAAKNLFNENIFTQNNKSDTILKTYNRLVKENDEIDVSIKSFIRNDKLVNKLNDIIITFYNDPSKNDLGYYSPSENNIVINLGQYTTNSELLDSIMHEFQHAVQHFNNLQSGESGDFIVTEAMINDVLQHVPLLYEDLKNKDTRDKYGIELAVNYYFYNTVTGEQLSRGSYNDYVYGDPTFVYSDGINEYFKTAWGTTHKRISLYGSDRFTSFKRKFTELSEGEKRKLTSEEVKENYEEASNYVNGINKALELIKQNKANGVKTYKKDLKQFKLPDDVVNDLIKGTYTKGADTRWTYYRRIVNTHDKGTSKQRHKKHFEEGRATDKGRQIFAKNAKGTNLEYWLEKYPNKIPEVDAAVQEFVISATDFKKLDRKLVNQIKNATLTWIGVENFIRDADNINQYTFNELKKAFFKNTPFKSFDEVKSFVNIVEKGSALSAALQSIGMSDQIYKEIKTDLSKFDEFLTKLSNVKAVKKIYDKNLVTFNTFYYKEGNKTTKIETNMNEASADIVLGLLKYFDRTIDSLSYIANNAKYALRRSAITGSAFTYKQKRDAAGNKTLSFDTNVKGKKDNESGHALYELIEDERQRLDENTDAENRDALMKAAYEHIASLMKDGKMSIDELKVLAQTYKKNIRSFSDDEVAYRLAVINTLDNTGITFDEALNVEELVTNIVDPEVTIEVGNVRNARQKVKHNIVKLLENLPKASYKNLPEEYHKYLNFDTGKANSDAIRTLSESDLNKLNTEILELTKRAKSNEFNSKTAVKAAEKLRKENERLRKENDELKKSKGETTSTTDTGKIVKTYDIKISTDVDITSTKPMPEKLKKIFETTFTKERASTKKFRFIENETYLRASMEEFFRQNAENLQNLTEQDVVEALEFFEQASILNRDYVPYDTIRSYLLGYFIEQSKIVHRFDLDASVLERMERMLDGMISNVFARGLSAWKGVMTLVDPTRTIVNEMLRIYDLDLEGEPEVDELSKALKHMYNKSTVKYQTKEAELEAFKNSVDNLNQIMQNLERKILEKYRKSRRDKSKDLKIFGKKFKRQNVVEVREILSKERLTVDDVKTIKTLLGNDIFNDMVSKKEITLTKSGAINRTKKSLQIFENALEKYEFAKIPSTRDLQNRILKFQKAMMLSAPATIVRNELSNLIIGGYTWKDAEGNYKHIGGLNDFADLLGRLVPAKIVGKTSVSQYNLVKVKVSKNTMEFIQKWVRETGLLDLVSDGLTKYDARETKVHGNLENQLISMIVKSTANRVLGTNTYDNDVLNNITNFIFKLQSDNTAIQNTALRLFGKMLEADKVDLTHGLNETVMTYLANAYSEAAYEYMHRGNVLNDLMNNLKQKHPNTYFVLNLARPFISSSWNWFVDTLQMNPVALAVNIRRLMTLENYVNKLDERRQKGDMSVPDSRFAEMLIRRNIGKGIIGTGLMLVGGLLAAFGKIVVDDEDEKLKLKIGNTYIDFSNVYGSSPILVGAQFGSGGVDFWTLLESAFNQQFEDSVLTTFMNAFRYDSTPWEYLTSLPTTIVSGFIPNVWKQAVKLTQNHTIDYDAGTLGNLQYLAVQTIPFIEYAMPKGIDPYTGEWEERYSVPAVHQLATLIGSPVSFKTYAKSDVELAFDEVGLNKKMLNGKYKDIGQVDTTYLNEFYGKRNKIRVSEFINNKVKYSVEDEKGKRQDLLYKQMTDEQRKSVLNRITTQNANYAKIYAWTQMGHKYYCSASERTELMKIGITKNIYIGNKGFVK